MVSARPISSRADTAMRNVRLGQASARLASAPENVPPGTTGSSLLVLCYMMRAIVHAWMGEFDESERCSGQAAISPKKNDRPYDMIAADYGRGLVQMMRGNLEEAESALDRASFAFPRERSPVCFCPSCCSRLAIFIRSRATPRSARDILLQAKRRGRSGSAMRPAWLRRRRIWVRRTASSATSSSGLDLVRACQASAKQKGYGGIEALARFCRGQHSGVTGSVGGGRGDRLHEPDNRNCGRLEARPLLGAARGLLARLLGRFRQDGRSTRRTRPGDRAF